MRRIGSILKANLPPWLARITTHDKIPSFKLTVMQYVIALILVILVSGLWRLQVLGAQNYRALAQANRIRKVPILAPRGKIFDRDGRLLVDNYPSVTCFLVPEQAHDLDSDIPLIAQGLHMQPDQLRAVLPRYRHQPEVSAYPAARGYHAGRAGVHRGARE